MHDPPDDQLNDEGHQGEDESAAPDDENQEEWRHRDLLFGVIGHREEQRIHRELQRNCISIEVREKSS